MDFSLRAFCQNIYRAKELTTDAIVGRLVENRIKLHHNDKVGLLKRSTDKEHFFFGWNSMVWKYHAVPFLLSLNLCATDILFIFAPL